MRATSDKVAGKALSVGLAQKYIKRTTKRIGTQKRLICKWEPSIQGLFKISGTVHFNSETSKDISITHTEKRKSIM